MSLMPLILWTPLTHCMTRYMKRCVMLSCVVLISACEPHPQAQPQAHPPSSHLPTEPRLAFEGELPELSPLPETPLSPLEVASSQTEEVTGRDEASLSPDVWDPNAFIRPRKRMDVDQLSRAFEQFAGGAGWQTSSGRDGWRARWATLGGPDFITRVTEDKRPTALFQKVIRDAALEVCLPLIERELPASGESPSERRVVVVEDPSAPLSDTPELRSALRGLLLRAHGVSVTEDELTRWVQMMVNIAHVHPAQEAWRALCVATLAHPRFWSY